MSGPSIGRVTREVVPYRKHKYLVRFFSLYKAIKVMINLLAEI